MNKKACLLLIFLLAVSLLALPGQTALAQTYLFQLDEQIVNVYWNEDGTAAIDYLFTFTNDPSASPIDYVDVGIPNSNFVDDSIYADVDGTALSDISRSGYQGNGTGVAVGLGGLAIRPGETGRVHVYVGTVRRVLFEDDKDPNYASAVFSPTWFGSQYVRGTTNVQVTFHMPPDVGVDEPRWHSDVPSGFPSEPLTSIDDEGRVIYTWLNAHANGHTQYRFGASFPKQYVPAEAVVTPTILDRLGISVDDLVGFSFCGGIGLISILSIVASVRGAQKRKMQYLPPKIAIEGHGIKRGLTAVEAALLLEQPLDKVMTMILFGVLKKEAATVVKRDPLQLELTDPLPADLQPYEVGFLEAFKANTPVVRRRVLQQMTIALVKDVSAKMKGFSRRETIAYYRDITQRAWAQVEAANTPEVKSAKFDEALEWTMLDRNYDDRTRDVFRTGPVYVPHWWGRYDPVYRSATSRPSAPSTAQPSSTPSFSKPNLPGADFAASMVSGVQNFSAGVVGNLSSFTEGITNKTNPVPVSTSSGGSSRSSGGGGGRSCACACACAGCACACAGGGR